MNDLTHDASEVIGKAKSGVLGAILAITKDLSVIGIAKDSRNTEQQFNFRGIDAVMDSLAPLYAKHHLVVVPSYANRNEIKRERTNAAGKTTTMFATTVEGSYTMFSTVDGSKIVAGPFFGEGADTGDKGTNKAMSQAFKYFALQTFCVPVVGTDDADAESGGADPVESTAAPDFIAKWTEALQKAATKADLLQIGGIIKDICAANGDANSWMVLKGVRDARGKALAQAANSK